MQKNILLVFTKNPELGRCKTRLAKSIGDHNALKVYQHLLKHTAEEVKKLKCEVAIFYSKFIDQNDYWPNKYYKKIQGDGHLGFKMKIAFQWAFDAGYKKVSIIGTDLLSLETKDINLSFELLEKCNVVFGPAEDGGYYLMGMNTFYKEAFLDKAWSTASVLKQTVEDLPTHKIGYLSPKNDIDTFEDLKKSDLDISWMSKKTEK